MNTSGAFKKTVNILTLASFLLWNLAVAVPEGGQVAAGNAAITQSGSTTTINQTSQNTVINWQGFDTASHEAVNFVQPNSSSIALNRINSGIPTNFQGSLSANGQVWIVNPSGVLFGASSKVDVAGLLVATHNITDSNFMSGNYQFNPVAGFENSKIINNGLITAKDSGMVGLVAPWVENNGTIIANLGKVHLASGSAFVLDMYGDQLINFGSNPGIQNGYVSNSGLIQANGGKVHMTANVAAGVVNDVISMSGTIEAKAVSVNQKGEIILYASDASTKVISGGTRVSGKLKASGGGFIETSGAYLIIEPTAEIDAGVGGSWLVDPINITVTSSTSNNSGPPSFTPSGSNSMIDVALINTQLGAGTNVTLNTSPAGPDFGDITISSAIAPPVAGGGTLFLIANRFVNINATITLMGQSLDVTAGSTINLGATVTTTGGSQIYRNPVVLPVDVAVTTTTGNISFLSTLNGSTSNTRIFTPTVTGGTLLFGGAIGNTNPLLTLTATGATQINSNVTTSSAQTYNNAVTLGATPVLTSTAGDIMFASTINGGGNALTISNFGAGSNVTGIISNLTSLIKNGSGTLTLTGANIYSGATNITGGTLEITNANALGGGVSLTTISNSTLKFNGNFNVTNNFIANSATFLFAGAAADNNVIFGTVNFNSGTSIVDQENAVGQMSGTVSGSGNITVVHTGVNPGQFNLAGPNPSYNGNIIVNGSSLHTGNSLGLGSTVGTLTINSGGHVMLNGSFTATKNIIMNGGTLAGVNGPTTLAAAGSINLASGTSTITAGLTSTFIINSIISGPGNLIANIVATSTTVLNANNTYQGTTTNTLGTLRIGSNTAIPSGNGFGNVTINGTLDVNGFSPTLNGLTGSGVIDNVSAGGARSVTVYDNAQNSTFSGVIKNTTGTLSLVTSGNGAFTLSGTNTYTGATIINAGILAISSDVNLGNVPGSVTANNIQFGGGTLQTTGTFTLNSNRGITLSSASATIQSVSGILTYNGVITGASALTFAGPGSISIGGNIGTPTAVTSITTNANLASFLISGNPTFTTAAGGTITFGGTVDGDGVPGRSLTLNATATGTVTFGGIVGATPLNALTVTGLTSINTTAITTLNNMTFNQAVTLGASPTLTTGAGGTITFGSTVQGGFNLTANASSTGTVAFNNDIGTVGTPLTNLTVTGNTTLAAAVGPTIFVSGTETFNQNVTINSLAALTFGSGIGSTTIFNGTVNRTGTSTAITIAGNLEVGPLGSIGLGSIIQSLLVNGTTLGPNVITAGPQNYVGALTLNTDETMTSTGSSITYGSTVDGDGVLDRNLTVNAATIATFNGIVGGGVALNSLNVTAGSEINFGTSLIKTLNSQVYSGVILKIVSQSAITFETVNVAGNSVSFNYPVWNTGIATDITVNGNLAFIGPAGGMNVTGGLVNSLHVTGTTLIDGGNAVFAQQDLTFDGVVTVGGNYGIGSQNGTTIFGSDLVSDASGPWSINVYGNIVEFYGKVGFSSASDPMNINDLQVSTYLGGINSGINFKTSGIVDTNGNQTYLGPVTMFVDSTLTSTAGNITFDSTVDGGFDLSVNAVGNVSFNGIVGGIDPLNSLIVAGNTVFVSTSLIQTINNQTYLPTFETELVNQPGGVTFRSTNMVGTAITFNTPVQDTVVSSDLTIDGNLVFTGSGALNVSFSGMNGFINNLHVTGTAVVGGNINTVNNQTYDGAVTLRAIGLFNSTNGGLIKFNSTVESGVGGPWSLIPNTFVTTPGAIEFNGIVGGLNGSAPINVLDLTLTTAIAINGSATQINTVGAQIYGAPVTLGTDTTLTSTAGNITFNGTVDGGFNLTANAAGALNFNGIVGYNTALNNLDLTGAVINLNTPQVTTSGDQIYRSPVIIMQNITPAIFLGIQAGGNVTFLSTIDSDSNVLGPWDLGIQAINIEFDGSVGQINPINNLNAVAGGQINLNTFLLSNFQMNAAGDLELSAISNQINLVGDVVLDALYNTLLSSISLSRVEGPGSLTIFPSPTATMPGQVTFGTEVGDIIPLGSLIVNSTDIQLFNTSIVNTVGDQTYLGPVVTPSFVNTVITAGGNVTFASTLDTSHNLASVTINAAGFVQFDGSVGGSVPSIGQLRDLVVTGSQININTLNLSDFVINATISQVYNSPVNITGTVTFDAINDGAASVQFANTVDGFASVIINPSATAFTPGTVEFDGIVGGNTDLNSLDVTGSAIYINTTQITATNAQNYTGVVYLINPNVVLNSGTAVTFNNTVEGPGGLIVNGNLFAYDNMGFNTSLGYLTVNGTATGINIISVGDINLGPFNVVTNDFVQSLAGNVSFLSGPVTLVSGNLTVLAAEQIFFGFGAGGVSGPGFALSASSFNPIYGSTGTGISGSVSVGQFSMGGVGGGDISPISQDSIVNGFATNLSFSQTTLLPGSSGFFCVNGICNTIPVQPNPYPVNIPPTEEFIDPEGPSCGVAGCDNLTIIIYPIGIPPELLYSSEESNLLGVVTDTEGDPSQAINSMGQARVLKVGSAIYKDDQLIVASTGCVCLKTTLGEKKCISTTRNYDETRHTCKIKNEPVAAPQYSLTTVLAAMKNKIATGFVSPLPVVEKPDIKKSDEGKRSITWEHFPLTTHDLYMR